VDRDHSECLLGEETSKYMKQFIILIFFFQILIADMCYHYYRKESTNNQLLLAAPKLKFVTQKPFLLIKLQPLKYQNSSSQVLTDLDKNNYYFDFQYNEHLQSDTACQTVIAHIAETNNDREQIIRRSYKLIFQNHPALKAVITWPPQYSLVRKQVPIYGLAYGSNFSRYTLFVSNEQNSECMFRYESKTAKSMDGSMLWKIMNFLTPPEKRNTLASFDCGTGFSEDSASWSAGSYIVRLEVYGQDGSLVYDEIPLEVGSILDENHSVITSDDGKLQLLVNYDKNKKHPVGVVSIKKIDKRYIETVIPANWSNIGAIYEYRGQKVNLPDAAPEIKFDNKLVSDLPEEKWGAFVYNLEKHKWQSLNSGKEYNAGQYEYSLKSIQKGWSLFGFFYNTNFNFPAKKEMMP